MEEEYVRELRIARREGQTADATATLRYSSRS